MINVKEGQIRHEGGGEGGGLLLRDPGSARRAADADIIDVVHQRTGATVRDILRRANTNTTSTYKLFRPFSKSSTRLVPEAIIVSKSD